MDVAQLREVLTLAREFGVTRLSLGDLAFEMAGTGRSQVTEADAPDTDRALSREEEERLLFASAEG